MIKPYMSLTDAKGVVESVVGTSKSIWESTQNIVKVLDGFAWWISHPSAIVELLKGTTIEVTIFLLIAMIILRSMGFETNKYIGLVFFLFLILMAI